MNIESKSSVARIREANDKFRTTFRGGQVLLTASVHAIPASDKAAALQAVAEFKDFNEENDPSEEHDYGAFDLLGREYWWKIDYFAPDMEHASDDPADPEKTRLVMTVGLAMDW